MEKKKKFSSELSKKKKKTAVSEQTVPRDWRVIRVSVSSFICKVALSALKADLLAGFTGTEAPTGSHELCLPTQQLLPPQRSLPGDTVITVTINSIIIILHGDLYLPSTDRSGESFYLAFPQVVARRRDIVAAPRGGKVRGRMSEGCFFWGEGGRRQVRNTGHSLRRFLKHGPERTRTAAGTRPAEGFMAVSELCESDMRKRLSSG